MDVLGFEGRGIQLSTPCAAHKTIYAVCFARHFYWIPAFAGMTTRSEKKSRKFDFPSVQ